LTSQAHLLGAAELERGNSIPLVVQQLRDLIVTGKLSPGTWMIEAELAERLGVSRTPIRGALQWLEREGFLVAVHSGSKSRTLVAPLTKEDSRELYGIIGHIEGIAARLTAQLPDESRGEVVRRLAILNGGLNELTRARQPAANRIFELDLEFHRTIVQASGGPRLMQLHRTTQLQAERYWRLYASAIMNKFGRSVREHRAIITAIKIGDSDGAEAGSQANWRNGADRLARVIEALGERGSWPFGESP